MKISVVSLCLRLKKTQRCVLPEHIFQTTNGIAKKTADVDWYEEEIYSRLPYAKQLLPLILCSYNLLTQNNIPEAPEERQYISNHYDPFEAGYRVLTYHSFPLMNVFTSVAVKHFFFILFIRPSFIRFMVSISSCSTFLNEDT